MKAAVYTHHGSPDVLSLSEVGKPAPGKHEVLIQVRAAALNALDSYMLRGIPIIGGIIDKFSKPSIKIPGVDLAGRVEAVGHAVKNFKIGDEVFGSGKNACAEFACAHEKNVVIKPPTISFESAASVTVAASTALQALRDHGKIKSGQQVLVYGAGGGVGTFLVQIAKSYGVDVTAVCGTHNVEMVRTLGADRVIDYTREDFSAQSKRFDLIIAVNGYHPVSTYRKVLKPTGTFVMAGASKDHIIKAMFQGMVLGPLLSILGKQKFRFFIANINQDDLLYLKKLLEEGKVTPVIDQKFPLSKTADAIRYLEKWHTRGKIIISL